MTKSQSTRMEKHKYLTRDSTMLEKAFEIGKLEFIPGTCPNSVCGPKLAFRKRFADFGGLTIMVWDFNNVASGLFGV